MLLPSVAFQKGKDHQILYNIVARLKDEGGRNQRTIIKQNFI